MTFYSKLYERFENQGSIRTGAVKYTSLLKRCLTREHLSANRKGSDIYICGNVGVHKGHNEYWNGEKRLATIVKREHPRERE
jgi:hypothetical protein